VMIQEYEQLSAFDGIDPATGPGNHCGRGDDGIEQLVGAIVHIRGQPGLRHAQVFAGISARHLVLLSDA
jgi:hypothetical protein